MKTCIIALLVVLVARGNDAFNLRSNLGIEMKGSKMSFPGAQAFYCAPISDISDFKGTLQSLQSFAQGNNVEGVTLATTGQAMILGSQDLGCAAACMAVRGGVTASSADGTITPYTFTTEEFYITKGPIPTSQDDVMNGFLALKADLESDGLISRASLGAPFILVGNDVDLVMYGAFLAPAKF